MWHQPCKNGWTNRTAWDDEWGGPRSGVSLDRRAHWCHLASTVERLCAGSMSGSVTTGGDAVCSQITFGNLIFTTPCLTTDGKEYNILFSELSWEATEIKSIASYRQCTQLATPVTQSYAAVNYLSPSEYIRAYCFHQVAQMCMHWPLESSRYGIICMCREEAEYICTATKIFSMYQAIRPTTYLYYESIKGYLVSKAHKTNFQLLYLCCQG